MTRLFIGILLLLFAEGQGQDRCTLSISGRVIDQHDGQALSFAEVLILNTGLGAVVDSAGLYHISGLCPGEYAVEVSHIGCEPVRRRIKLYKPIVNLDFYLEHHQELLQEVVLTGQNIRRESKTVNLLNQEALRSIRQLGLENLAAQVAGVSSINSGNNILKPVVHGMYGNRVTTTVNGIILEDQQWGREHGLNVSPEMMGQIAVVSGAAAVEYGPGALGGVVVFSSAPIPVDSVLRGELNLQARSNGRGGSARLRLEQAVSDFWHYRIQLSGSRLGDMQAPQYNLSNTGFAGFNYSLETGYRHGAWQGKLFYQATNRELGILRASSTGNLTDLEEAINRAEPLYQKDFQYNIEAPRQEVAHHLVGTEWRYRPESHRYWELRYGFQNNRRKEFDLRRGVSDELPANNLQLITHSVDLKYHHEHRANWHSKYGISAIYQINSNIPGTGIRPILPNYNRYRLGGFMINEWDLDRWVLQAGLRYDYEYTLAQKYDRQNVLQKPAFSFNNLSANLGTTFRINHQWQISSDLALASRPPHTIELLSEGLHHGAASIELGDSNLIPEQSLNWSNTLRFSKPDVIYLELTAYINPVNHYIFQIADSLPQLTIRGAFPVWRYVQSNALLTGIDLTLKTEVSKKWQYGMLGSFVRGYDLGNAEDLILMPPPRINQWLGYRLSESWRLKLTHEWTATQIYYPEDLDLSAPPPSYNLLHLSLHWEPAGKNYQCTLHLQNLTNASYRMNLDRFRYYADMPGVNLILNFNYQF